MSDIECPESRGMPPFEFFAPPLTVLFPTSNSDPAILESITWVLELLQLAYF